VLIEFGGKIFGETMIDDVSKRDNYSGLLSFILKDGWTGGTVQCRLTSDE
jgi:hypothetical protein